MKLRNKETGETGYFCFANWNDPVLIIMDKNGVQLAKYNSLDELNADWEDYELPKKFWYIEAEGSVYGAFINEAFASYKKEIGNYFDTIEEAEKAVEKLKAWKRLKDKGFEITGWAVAANNELRFFGHYSRAGVKDDLDLLFSQEGKQ